MHSLAGAAHGVALDFKPSRQMLPGLIRCAALACLKSRRVVDDHGSVALGRAPATPAPACVKRLVMVCVYSDPMEGMPEGLTDKLYWRRARGQWHCFKKLAQVRRYISLCHRQEISSVRGQKISRPEAPLRCGLCDELEMEQRGWESSGPVSPRRAGSGTRARAPFQ